uniref:RING-type domain-containing protein n=1 Tax=viral metagenome TaxID=1070528 RepID=A0A6C0H7X6_9ZZZZ
MEIIRDIITVCTDRQSVIDNITVHGINSNDYITIKYTIDNIIKYIKYQPHKKTHIYVYFEILNKSSLWNISYNINTYRTQTNNYKYEIIITVNLNCELILEYLSISVALNYIILELYSDLSNYTNTDLYNKSLIPRQNNNCNISKSLKINLYNYQKNSLGKMLLLENNNNEQYITYSYNLNLNNIKVNYNPITNIASNINNTNNNELYFKIKTKGGILSDEMGLGKTITSIALILSNPSTNQSQITEHNKLISRATLIICPSHLAKQWETEIKKTSNLKVTNVLSKIEFNHYTFNDFINTDVIITSHQFIMNFKFYPMLYYKPCTATTYEQNSRNQSINKFLLQTICDYNYNQIKELDQPLFEFFNFHRLIVDEGHEIFGECLSNHSVSRYMAQWLNNIDAEHYWYISGTPFVNYAGVKNASNFIKLTLEDTVNNINYSYNQSDINNNDININDFIHKEYLWLNILEKICIRHRKEDIENEISIPGYTEEIIWLELTDLEKELYDSRKNKMTDSYLQKLCCHPLILDTSRRIFGDMEVDLSIMQDKLIEYHKKNCETIKGKLEKLIPGKPEYHMLKKTYETQMHESHYLYQILEKMKSPEGLNNIKEECCCICMEPMSIPALTKCGHLFCSVCLKKWLSEKELCPVCKYNLKDKEIFLVKSTITDTLIEKYGSKLGKLISLIKSLINDYNSKIIVFSQWDDMLTLISKTLIANDINNSCVKGNSYKRTAAINNFVSNIDKVIMLSLKNAASGTNLINATHIIFVDPINGCREEINSIECQAIARACRIGQTEKIKIIRILIKSTIEEDIYNKYYK